jgi:4'-phosphopantetheinyl transferase
MTGIHSDESWRGVYLGVELIWSPLPGSITPGDLATLSEAERTRADALTAPRRRLEYVGARAQLRRALGAVLRVSPAAVPIDVDNFGKPQSTAGGVQFNLSHSAGALLIGWGDRPLGVDLESAARSVRHILRVRIVNEVREAAAIDPIVAFTLVEAATKALGRGLGAIDGLRLDAVGERGELHFSASPACLICARIVPLPEAYVGAVAVVV